MKLVIRTLNILVLLLIVYLGGRYIVTHEKPTPHFSRPLSGEVEQHASAVTETEATPVETEVAQEPELPEVLPETLPEEPPLKAEPFAAAMHYEVTLTGFTVADIYVNLQSDGGTDVEIQSIIQSSGIADIAGGYKSRTTTIARAERSQNAYHPVSYNTQFKLKGDWRTIELRYNDDGKTLRTEANEPPEKRWKRKEVEAALKLGSLDPLSLGLIARQRLREAVKDGVKAGTAFTLPLYDGRRRSDLAFAVLGETPEGNIAISFTEIPVAGYTDNEMKSFKDNAHTIHLTVSPKTFLPVQANAVTILGTAEIRLKRQCDTLEACMQ